jgi:hypothetical protein
MLCMNLCKLHIDSAYPIDGHAGQSVSSPPARLTLRRSLADLAETLASDVPRSPDRADRGETHHSNNEGRDLGREMVIRPTIKSR